MNRLTANERAVKLLESLSLVNELRIPVVTRDRVRLKERSKLARQLFKTLGLKGISVTVPTGANCHWVDVSLPHMDHDQSCTYHTRGKCPACHYERRARLAIEEILQRAFPREIDLSDDATDYFAPAWCINTQGR